jgi:protein-tyrosine-phosphatase
LVEQNILAKQIQLINKNFNNQSNFPSIMNILYICKANVGRSQMAEAFLNAYALHHTSTSAGTHVFHREGQKLDPIVIECMGMGRYDLSEKTRTQLTEDIYSRADIAVIMTNPELLPAYAQDDPKNIVWAIDDPKGKSLDDFCAARDEIRLSVLDLLRQIGD